MGWFIKTKKSAISPDVWEKCKKCEEPIFAKDLRKNCWVCHRCGYHFRINPAQRIELLLDEDSFEEFDSEIMTADPIEFKAITPYLERAQRDREKTQFNEAIVTGRGTMQGLPVVVGVFNFAFMGGSMGSVVGEKIVRMADRAIQLRHPVILFSTSGGARMHEGILSLMQMIKTGQAMSRLARERIPYISVLTDPTTGGVTASFAMMGDIIIAEPGALIGFAGPRVIEQTIKQTLPEGFQRSEFTLEMGVIDMVVSRVELNSTLLKIIRFFES